ncbi:TetR/AcrR family transcriptional regulator [Herbiconiux sp.]|uniref:TetR/AcrR family transcriptional regulator n=1 Tax=Herbiconiux sp. TaxID=1871186 RepID=UPI0025C61746|nr:TetR/AcrR family transcriptional regulator [Herbiconiux sp.]
MTTALFVLLDEHDLTEISISELCRTAGVHRTTFYGHYADIYAFAGDSFGSILDQLADLDQLDAGQQSASVEAITASYYDSVRAILAHILEHRRAYRMMFSTRVDAGFRRELHQRLLRHADVAVANWRRFGLAQDVDPESAAAFIAGGSVGVLEQWALSNATDVDRAAADIVGTTEAWLESRRLAESQA